VVVFVEWCILYDLVIIDSVINRDGSLIYISSPYNNGGALFKFDGTNLKQLWKNRNMRSMYNTPILVEGNEIGTGTLYGVDGDNGSGRFAAIDFKTGELKYRSRLRFGNFIMADNKFIYNIERGKLVFIKPDSNRFIELKSGRVIIEGKLWNIPVLANGYIYCRSSSGKLVCLKVK
jgi:outer membrane protein assembly factor BamB